MKIGLVDFFRKSSANSRGIPFAIPLRISSANTLEICGSISIKMSPESLWSCVGNFFRFSLEHFYGNRFRNSICKYLWVHKLQFLCVFLQRFIKNNFSTLNQRFVNFQRSCLESIQKNGQRKGFYATLRMILKCKTITLGFSLFQIL